MIVLRRFFCLWMQWYSDIVLILSFCVSECIDRFCVLILLIFVRVVLMMSFWLSLCFVCVFVLFCDVFVIFFGFCFCVCLVLIVCVGGGWNQVIQWRVWICLFYGLIFFVQICNLLLWRLSRMCLCLLVCNIFVLFVVSSFSVLVCGCLQLLLVLMLKRVVCVVSV